MASNRLTVLTTGGTIGSIVTQEAIAIGESGKLLQPEIEKIVRHSKLKVDIETVFNKHSEDLSPRDWIAIAEKVEKVAGSGVSKVVITHGTDTLAYTGTALSLFFGQSKDARICLTGSFYSLEDPRTDAPLNLLTALRCVSSGKIPPGVYVAFRANEKNKVAMLRHAHTIKPMSFDGIAFHGAFGEYVATFEPKSGIQMAEQAASKPDLGFPSLADRPLPSQDQAADAASRVVFLQEYPGMNVGILEKLSADEHVKAIVVGLYHSGTAASGNSNNDLKSFIKQNSQKIPAFLATFPHPYLETPYESTIKLIKAGGNLYKGLQAHHLFVTLTLGLAQGRSVQDLIGLLAPWRLTNGKG